MAGRSHAGSSSPPLLYVTGLQPEIKRSECRAESTPGADGSRREFEERRTPSNGSPRPVRQIISPCEELPRDLHLIFNAASRSLHASIVWFRCRLVGSSGP